jgi:hypothetical protein
MKNAVIGVVVFVLFIALVEWQRRTAILPNGFGAKLPSSSTLSTPTPPSITGRTGRRDATRLQGEAKGAASPLLTGGDAGSSEQSRAPAGGERVEDPEVARKKAEAVMVAIERLLDGESRDEPWATEIETWMQAEYGRRAGSRLERVTCKQTLCLVVVLHDSDFAYHTWLSRLITDEKHLRAMTMPGLPDAGKTRSKTYLFRETVGESKHAARRTLD